MEITKDFQEIAFFAKKYGIDKFIDNIDHSFLNIQKYRASEVIIGNKKKMEKIFFLVSGKIKILTLQENGKRVLIRFSTPLNILGDLEFLSDYPIETQVEAVTDVIFITINQDEARRKLYNDSDFLRLIIINLGHKLKTMTKNASNNLLYPLKSRLASYLLSISHDENKNKLSEDIMTSNLTDIAEFLGTTYRHLNRVLKELEEKNIIRREPKHIKILNMEQLISISNALSYE